VIFEVNKRIEIENKQNCLNKKRAAPAFCFWSNKEFFSFDFSGEGRLFF